MRVKWLKRHPICDRGSSYSTNYN